MGVHDELMRRTLRSHMSGDGLMAQAGKLGNLLAALLKKTAWLRVLRRHGQSLFTAASPDAPKCPCAAAFPSTELAPPIFQ